MKDKIGTLSTSESQDILTERGRDLRHDEIGLCAEEGAKHHNKKHSEYFQ